MAEAILQIAQDGLADPVLVGSPDRLRDLGLDDPRFTAVDPDSDSGFDALVQRLVARRRHRGMTEPEARELARRPLIFAALLVASGRVDGSVAGVANTTADVLRAGIWAVGPAEGIATVSASFFMVVGDSDVADHRHGILSFTDPAVVPDPTPHQLAEIAMAAADARRRVVGDEPRIAFLSYSTKGSSGGPRVDKVREAVAVFRELAPEIEADGELQVDAALVETVARRKAPRSAVAGHANVLVFPDLDAANIGYKLVQWLGRADAIGPIVQGLARPCNDLSRGASTEDIVDVACITALMA